MSRAAHVPWLHDALALVEIRPGDRVLQLTAHEVAIARALLELCGRDGTVVAIESDFGLAEQAAGIGDERLHVVSIEPDGSESFGRFDALVACPIWDPDWPVDRWAQLPKRHLRPGGRFVIDLPAETACEPILTSWRDALGADDARAARWVGNSEEVVAAALRDAGLRNVEGVVGTHLVKLESPRALAELAFAGLPRDEDAIETLSVALASRLETITDVEVVFHRTRICGIR